MSARKGLYCLPICNLSISESTKTSKSPHHLPQTFAKDSGLSSPNPHDIDSSIYIARFIKFSIT